MANDGACVTSKSRAAGDLADFGVFEEAVAKFFDGGLEHGAAQVVAMDVEAGEWLQEKADGVDCGVEFGESGRRLGVDESGAPAIGFDH